MELEKKVALITGASTGVGRATAIELARRGCAVAVNYNRSKHAAEETVSKAEKLGVKAIAVKADVSVDHECRAMVERVIREFGHMEVLINNAGTTTFINHADLDKVTDNDWDAILGVNLKGPFFCTRAAKAALIEAGGGEIVMTSSIAGLAGVGSSIPYCASKAALNTMTVSLARVLGSHNIRVNAVAPGFIDGDWLRNGLGDAFNGVKQANEQKSPLKKVVCAEDVAQTIAGIISGPDVVTGHVIPVEAGLLLRW